jgi:hypothetical protein
MPVPGHLLILGQKADLLGIRVMDAAGANNFQVREARHLVQGLPGSDLIPIASDDHPFFMVARPALFSTSLAFFERQTLTCVD